MFRQTSCPATKMPLKTEGDINASRGESFHEPREELARQERPEQQSPPSPSDKARTMPELTSTDELANSKADLKQDLILNPSKVLALRQPGASNEKRLPQLAEFHESTTVVNQHGLGPLGDAGIRPTRKRYFILFMFFILQIVKSFQWICLASITNVVAKFYRVDNLAINWTTILFMVTFLVLALPVSWIMDTIGLRRSVLIGAIGVTLGIFIKCFSCNRDGFAISMWGHLIVGLCEPFFFSSYSQLASVWFPDNQVALATAISLIGEQTGLALGFMVPPLIIGNDPNDFAAIQRGLFGLFTMVALISILNTISIVLFFDDEPRLAPGIARYKQKQDETIRRQSLELEFERKRRRRSSTISHRLSLGVGEQVKLSIEFMQNKHFMLLLAGFGICEGVCYSIHTLLNQMIVQPASLVELSVLLQDETALSDSASTIIRRPEPSSSSSVLATAAIATNATTTSQDQFEMAASSWAGDEATLVVGNAGLILIVSGLLGSACCGFLLDKYHKHKPAMVLIYLLNLLAMAALTGCLLLESPLAFYLATIPLGFSQLGYATCAFDYSVELTYPKPELVSSTLLNISAQIFGIPISLVGSMIVDNLGSLALGLFFCLLLLVGFAITCLQGGELRRRSAVEDHGGCGKDGQFGTNLGW